MKIFYSIYLQQNLLSTSETLHMHLKLQCVPKNRDLWVQVSHTYLRALIRENAKHKQRTEDKV